MAQKSVNQKYSLILMETFRFKAANPFVGWYYGIVSCALNMEDLILNSL
jgi:hypothetical protein